MAIKQDIKEINIYAMSNSNAYFNLSHAEKLDLLRKLVSTTLAISNPSGRARNRESVGRLVANFEDNFIKFYTNEMGMSQKELATFFATKLKDEQSLLGKEIPNLKQILTIVGNVFKEVKTIEKEIKNFDENTSMAELDSYLEKMLVAYRTAYAESSKMKRINELTTIEPIKFLAYIDKSIVTLEANIAIALKHGIPVDEFQNILNLLKQLKNNPKLTFKMTNEEIKDLRKKVVAAKRNLTIKIKQATQVIVRRIGDIKDDDSEKDMVSKPKQKTPEEVAKFNLGKAQAKFIVENWTKILKIDDKQLQADLANISANEMDFIRQLKQALDTNNDKLLEGLLQRVYKNPDKSVIVRESLIDYIAGVVGRGVGILKGVFEAEPVNGTPAKTDTPVVPVKPVNGGDYTVSFTLPGTTYELSDQQRELWNYLNAFENAGQNVSGNNTEEGEQPTEDKNPRKSDVVVEEEGRRSETDKGFDGEGPSNSEGIVRRGEREETSELGGDDYSKNDFADEDEVVTDADETLDSAKSGEETSETVSENNTEETNTATNEENTTEPKKEEKIQKKGFWATIGGGLKAVGKWILRKPVLALTIGALVALPFSYASALTLIPKLVLYGAGALIAGNGVKALVRGIVKPYDRFIHKYDVDAQQKKLDKRMRKRERILEKINTELADTAVREGVAIPAHTRVQVKDSKINKQYAANAQHLAEAERRMHTPVSGMDKKKIKRLQGLSDELIREEAAIERERARVMGKFDTLEDIDYTDRGRTDLAEADRAERTAFARRTDMTPTAGNRTAVEVGRMGRKGIGAAANAEAEVEGLLRERDEIDARAHRQRGRELNAEEADAAKKARKAAKTSSSSYTDDRDDKPSGGSAASSTDSTTASTPRTSEGPTKKELKAQKMAEAEAKKKVKKSQKSEKKKEKKGFFATIGGLFARKPKTTQEDNATQPEKNIPVVAETTETEKKPARGIAKKAPKRESRAASKAEKNNKKVSEAEQKALDAEIKANAEEIDKALATSKNCQDFWNRLDVINGLSGQARYKIKTMIGPFEYADAKAQAVSRIETARQKRFAPYLKSLDEEIASKKAVIDKEIYESKSFEEFKAAIAKNPQLTESARRRFLDTYTENQYEQRKLALTEAANREQKKADDKRLKKEIDDNKEAIQEIFETAPTLAQYQKTIDDMGKKGVLSADAVKYFRSIYSEKDFANKGKKQAKIEQSELMAKVQKQKPYIEGMISKSKHFNDFNQILNEEYGDDPELLSAIQSVYDRVKYKDLKQRFEADALNAELSEYGAEVEKIYNSCHTPVTMKAADRYNVFFVKFQAFSKEKGMSVKAHQKFLGKYGFSAFEKQIEKELQQGKSLLKTHQATIDKAMLDSENWGDFSKKLIIELCKNRGVTFRELDIVLLIANQDYYNERKSKLVAQAQQAQQKQDKKILDTEIRQLSGNIDKLFKEGSMNKAQFDKHLEGMVANGEMSKGAFDYFRTKYDQEMFEARDNAIAAAKKRQEPMLFNKLVRENGNKIDGYIYASSNLEEFKEKLKADNSFTAEEKRILAAGFTEELYSKRKNALINALVKNEAGKVESNLENKFNECRKFSDFRIYLEELYISKKITEHTYKYLVDKYTLDKFNAKEKRINKQRTQEDIKTIMTNFVNCVDLDKAKNLLEYIKVLELKYGYEFTSEAKAYVKEQITASEFSDQKTGKTFKQAGVEGKSFNFMIPTVNRIWKECDGDVKKYREAIDKSNMPDDAKVYFKDAAYINKLMAKYPKRDGYSS